MANYSERDLGIKCNLKPPGQDPQTAYEKIRKEGIALDELLPFSDKIDTLEKYYSYFGGDKNACDRSSKEFLSKFSFKHDWVASGINVSPEIMKEALKHSPLGVAVYAWATNEKGLYIRLGNDAHWTVCYGYVDGQYWKIFDSYDNTHKKLVWDFGFRFVKRIHIELNLGKEQDPFQKFLSWLFNLIKLKYV